MKFEDLTHVDFAKMSRKIPAKYTFPDIKRMVKEVAEKYKLAEIEASTAWFIAADAKDEYKQIDHVVKSRTKQLLVHRKANIKSNKPAQSQLLGIS